MIEKKCIICDSYKNIEEFVRNKVIKSGYSNRCKSCHNKICRVYITKNQAYYTKKSNEYRKTAIGKIKNHAHQKVKTAIRSGKLIRMGCEICGNMKSEAHHPDYSKPLNIIWLCSFHHKEWHKKNKKYGL